MHTSTVIVLACLLAVVVAARYEHYPEIDRANDAELHTPAHESSPRAKRSLLLLKKKLLLGALGLKAVKVGAVGAAGVAGALALKSKAGITKTTIKSGFRFNQSHKHPEHTIEVHSKHHNHINEHNHKHGIPQSYLEVHDSAAEKTDTGPFSNAVHRGMRASVKENTQQTRETREDDIAAGSTKRTWSG